MGLWNTAASENLGRNLDHQTALIERRARPKTKLTFQTLGTIKVSGQTFEIFVSDPLKWSSLVSK
jgi:hypothetical protein